MLMDEQFYENKEKDIISSDSQAPGYFHNRGDFLSWALKSGGPSGRQSALAIAG